MSILVLCHPAAIDAGKVDLRPEGPVDVVRESVEGHVPDDLQDHLIAQAGGTRSLDLGIGDLAPADLRSGPQI